MDLFYNYVIEGLEEDQHQEKIKKFQFLKSAFLDEISHQEFDKFGETTNVEYFTPLQDGKPQEELKIDDTIY